MFANSHIININNYSILSSSSFPDPNCTPDIGACRTDGDNHGNTIKALSYARYYGYLIIADADFNRLAQIFNLDIEQITKEHIQEIDDIFARINSPPEAQSAKIRFLGDIFIERRGFEYISLKYFEKLSQEHIQYKLVLSNHDFDLLCCYERKIKNPAEIFQPVHNTDENARSIIHLQYLISKGMLSEQKIMELIENYVYHPDILIPIDYTVTKEIIHDADGKEKVIERIAYFTHAPFDNYAFKDLARALDVPFAISHHQNKINTLNNIRTEFKKHVINKSVSTLNLSDFIWNRIRNNDARDADALYINGHETPFADYTFYGNELLLDNPLGKTATILSNYGIATALYSHDTVNPDDNQFYKELESLRTKIPNSIVQLFQCDEIDDLINFSQLYSRNQIKRITELLCQDDSVDLWKELLTDHWVIKLRSNQIKYRDDLWGVFWLLQKCNILNKETVRQVLLKAEYCHDLFKIMSILCNYNAGDLFTCNNIFRLILNIDSCYKISKLFIEMHNNNQINQPNTYLTQKEYDEICDHIDEPSYPLKLKEYRLNIIKNSYPNLDIQDENSIDIQFLDIKFEEMDQTEYIINRLNQITPLSRIQLHALMSQPESFASIEIAIKSFEPLTFSNYDSCLNKLLTQQQLISHLFNILIDLLVIKHITSDGKNVAAYPEHIFEMVIQNTTAAETIKCLCKRIIHSYKKDMSSHELLKLTSLLFTTENSFNNFLIFIQHNKRTFPKITQFHIQFTHFNKCCRILDKLSCLKSEYKELLINNINSIPAFYLILKHNVPNIINEERLYNLFEVLKRLQLIKNNEEYIISTTIAKKAMLNKHFLFGIKLLIGFAEKQSTVDNVAIINDIQFIFSIINSKQMRLFDWCKMLFDKFTDVHYQTQWSDISLGVNLVKNQLLDKHAVKTLNNKSKHDLRFILVITNELYSQKILTNDLFNLIINTIPTLMIYPTRGGLIRTCLYSFQRDNQGNYLIIDFIKLLKENNQLTSKTLLWTLQHHHIIPKLATKIQTYKSSTPGFVLDDDIIEDWMAQLDKEDKSFSSNTFFSVNPNQYTLTESKKEVINLSLYTV